MASSSSTRLPHPFYKSIDCKTFHLSLATVVAAFALYGCSSSANPAPNICPGEIVGDLSLTPTIEIVVANQNDERIISGFANNLNASIHRIVLYARTDRFYVQPLVDSPFTSVCSDGSWQNTSHPWDQMVALLVDESFVPVATSEEHPSDSAGVLAWDEYPGSSEDRIIEFSGYTWRVKTAADYRVGPGPNYFSDQEEDVWVDDQGLHLTTTHRENKWFSTEVVLLEPLGYGSYTFGLSSRVDNLDTRAVFAGFVYESLMQEIDIEFSNQLASPDSAQYVVQPWTTTGNVLRFDAPAIINTSHRIIWHSTDIQFVSWIGHEQDPPDTASVIQEWTYAGPDVPIPGGERMRFNLWLFDGLEPLDGSADEVTIESFTFDDAVEK